MFKHILVPTDGSDLSKLAIRKAVDFAAEIKAKITFLYAKPDYPIAFYDEGAMIDSNTVEKFTAMANRRAQEILEEAQAVAQGADVRSTLHSLTSDRPFEAIIQTATEHQCDLIFMASHGRRGLSGLILGSETQKVLTHSKIPILVFR